MKTSRLFLAISIAGLSQWIGPAAYSQNVSLSEVDRKSALDLLAAQGGFEVAQAGKPRHLVATAAVPSASPEQPGRILARLVQYDYGTGKTIVSHVDLAARKVVSTESREAYPTPVSAQESALAIKAARQKNPQIEALYQNDPASVKVETLAPVIIDKQSPQYGKRIIHLRFYRQKGGEAASKALREEVNLSDTPPQAALQPAGGEPLAQAIENVTGVLEQHFPANQPESGEKSRWKIEYGLGTHFASGEILYIKSASFRQGHDKPWVKILGDCRLAEIFVPYNGGSPRFYDMTMGFGLAPLTEGVLGPVCLGPAKILHNRIATEVHDAGTMWLDHRFNPVRAVRNQQLELWSAFAAGNYVYQIKYSFAADGSVGFHLGATAHNFFDHKDDSSTHLHMGTWRLNVDLGNQAANAVKAVKWLSSTGDPAAQTVAELFAGGKEGAMEWNANQFTHLRIESTTQKNAHNPASFIAYDLVPSRAGVPRIPELWAQKEFWVTLPESASGVPQWAPAELPDYVATPRPTVGKPAVIWYHSGTVHSARDEDYGINGYDSNEGVATTAWTGFKLKPRNLHPSTPFYP